MIPSPRRLTARRTFTVRGRHARQHHTPWFASPPPLSTHRILSPMSRYWSAVTRGLTPYVPGEQPKLDNLVKLNTNEHPYGPSPRAIEAIGAETSDSLRLYPDPTSEKLRSAIARHFSLDPSEVFVVT